MKHLKILKTLSVFIVVSLIFPSSTYAYLDPGSGSYVFQMFIALFIGIIVAMKTYWRRLLSIVKKIILKKNESNAQDSKKS